MTSKMDGRVYLQKYFPGLESHSENVGVMRFVVEACKSLRKDARVLEFASGPAIYTAIPPARTASTIVLSDISPELLGFSERWKDGQSDAFNWDPYINKVLEIEASQGIISGDSLESRREKVQKAIEFAVIDILKPQLVTISQSFDLVQCPYLGTSCASSHASLLEIWKKCASHVVPGGTLVIIEVCDTAYCMHGEQKILTHKIGYEEQVKLIDELGLHVIDKEFLPVDMETKHDYSGFAMFRLRKPNL